MSNAAATRNTETLTDAMIKALRAEAGAAGDMETVGFCDAAEYGDEEARIECADMISKARAMGDDDWTKVVA
jgi:hypothetical protein